MLSRRLRMRDIDIIVDEILEYCEKEQNYSYVEMREYARINNLDWCSAFRRKNSGLFLSEYFKGARRELREKGIHQPTLRESMDKIDRQRESQQDSSLSNSYMPDERM